MMVASVLLTRSKRKSFSRATTVAEAIFPGMRWRTFEQPFPSIKQRPESNIDLRSSAIGTTFSAGLAFIPRIRARRVSSSTTSTPVPVTRLGLLIKIHEIVISITITSAVPQLLHCLLNVHIFLALQDVVHNLSHPLVTLAEPAERSIPVLCLALHPEEMSLTAGGEFEDVDAAEDADLQRRRSGRGGEFRLCLVEGWVDFCTRIWFLVCLDAWSSRLVTTVVHVWVLT
jgi:hypothetical protein